MELSESAIVTSVRSGAAVPSDSLPGSITLQTSDLKVLNGSRIAMEVEPDAQALIAGDINVAADSILLDNRSEVRATAASHQDGGNLLLQANDLFLLRRNSVISSGAGTAASGGNGGNIAIDAPFLIAISSEDSDITANVFEGDGGNVNINAQGIFGLEFREKATPRSDIIASSEFGRSGNVALNSPDTTSIENSLSELPDTLINTDTLVASSCIAQMNQGSGRLVVAGADGIFQQPRTPGISNFSTGAVQTMSAAEATAGWEPGNDIAEPHALYRLVDGRIVLSRACALTK